MEQIDVIVGTILKGKKSLVERRRLDEKVDPDIVCLPGGHIRKGESREEALKREMLEELGKVNGFMFICKNFYIVSNGERQNAYCYLVTNYEGTPICQSAREIFWEDSIDNLTLEVDKKTIKKLKNHGVRQEPMIGKDGNKNPAFCLYTTNRSLFAVHFNIQANVKYVQISIISTKGRVHIQYGNNQD